MRAFLALELPPTVREACGRALDRLRTSAGRLRLTPAGQLHVTLAFLGEIDAARAAAVAEAVGPVIRAAPAWPLRVRGCGAFPRLAHARILWLGVDDADGRCAALAATVWGRLVPLGFTPEARPFSAHVTFARIRTGRLSPELRAAVEAAATFDSGAEPVRRVVLMESVLGPAGSTYREVDAFPLA